MKYILLLLGLLLVLPVAVYPTAIVNNSGTTSEDSVTMFVNCLDSLGNPATCDSFFALTFKSATNTAHFRDSGALVAMTGMDTTKVGGRSVYYYHREVAGIDGAGAAGTYSLVVIGKINAGSGWLTTTSMNFQISPKIFALTDTTNAILDTLQLQDGWAAKEASVQIIRDTLALYDNWLRDSVHNQSVVVLTEITKVKDTVNGILDTLQLYDAWLRDSVHNQSVVVLTEVTKVKDTVNGLLDSIQLYDGRWALADTANAILDTLQLYDGRYALAAELTKVTDTTNAVLDTLQNAGSNLRGGGTATLPDSVSNMVTILNRVKDTVNGVMDTLQNAGSDLRGGGVATLPDSVSNVVTIVNRVRDTVNALLDTLQVYDGRWAIATATTEILDTLKLYDGRWALQDSLTAAHAKVDTLGYMTGYKLGSLATLTRNATCDTLTIWNGTAAKWLMLLWHVGGATGDSPDSTRVISAP